MSLFNLKENHIFEVSDFLNAVALGDNVAYMNHLLDSGYEGRINAIYIDPPFFTKSSFDATVSVGTGKEKYTFKHSAYDDLHQRDMDCYLAFLRERLVLMKSLLADDGLIWVHLDWHSVHYVKVLMDEIFGMDRFANEIIWKYKSGGSSPKHFSRKHDSILVYSKSKDYYLNVPKEKSYNRGLKPYRFKGVAEYCDEYGWYTMVNMKDVWSLDMVGRTSAERTGYATQKPLELMKRIVNASTRPGDICADFFCGSGSLLSAANALGRHFVGCDAGTLAIGMTKKRLDDERASYGYFVQEGIPAWESHCNDIRVTRRVMSSFGNGKSEYYLSIDGFKPVINENEIDSKSLPDVLRSAEDRPFDFIDYVMIDTDYNGTFSCEQLIGGAESLKFKTFDLKSSGSKSSKASQPDAPELKTSDFENLRVISRGNIALIIVDIFGKEYFIEQIDIYEQN